MTAASMLRPQESVEPSTGLAPEQLSCSGKLYASERDSSNPHGASVNSSASRIVPHSRHSTYCDSLSLAINCVRLCWQVAGSLIHPIRRCLDCIIARYRLNNPTKTAFSGNLLMVRIASQAAYARAYRGYPLQFRKQIPPHRHCGCCSLSVQYARHGKSLGGR